MGLDKFMKDDLGKKNIDKSEDIHIPSKNYKDKVNIAIENSLNSTYNLMDIPEKKESSKKVPMSIYFEENDITLLKAIAYKKGMTVNNLIMDIIKRPLETTRDNLPNSFDISTLANQYDLKSNKTGRKKIKK